MGVWTVAERHEGKGGFAEDVGVGGHRSDDFARVPAQKQRPDHESHVHHTKHLYIHHTVRRTCERIVPVAWSGVEWRGVEWSV